MGVPVPPGPDAPLAARRVPVSKERLVIASWRVLLGAHAVKCALLVQSRLVVGGVLTRELADLFGRGPAVRGALAGWHVLLVVGELAF